jgi:hypothetical protein
MSKLKFLLSFLLISLIISNSLPQKKKDTFAILRCLFDSETLFNSIENIMDVIYEKQWENLINVLLKNLPSILNEYENCKEN